MYTTTVSKTNVLHEWFFQSIVHVYLLLSMVPNSLQKSLTNSPFVMESNVKSAPYHPALAKKFIQSLKQSLNISAN